MPTKKKKKKKNQGALGPGASDDDFAELFSFLGDADPDEDDEEDMIRPFTRLFFGMRTGGERFYSNAHQKKKEKK